MSGRFSVQYDIQIHFDSGSVGSKVAYTQTQVEEMTKEILKSRRVVEVHVFRNERFYSRRYIPSDR